MSPPPIDAATLLSVLIIDDDHIVCALIRECVESQGCRARVATTAADALSLADKEIFDLAFLDLHVGQDNGLDLLSRLLAAQPALWVVLVTGHAAIDTAVEAIRRGAKDYLSKPFSPDRIQHAIRQVVDHRRLYQRVQDLEGRLRSELPDVDLDSTAPAMRSVLSAVERAAASEATVLLRGESGTGKGVLARALHDHSARAARPFVVVNCPTLSDELLASELFGHAKGSFTGAVRDQIGRVETAQGGTLFLDEVAEISPNLQAKLLRFLQDREFERVGEQRTRRADVRLIAATNRDLEADVRSGRFREDLYYRLGVVELTVPPLRERREDIMALAERFLRFFAGAVRRPNLSLDPVAAERLRRHDWPGNVRELRNAIERAVVFATGEVVRVEDLPVRLAGSFSSPRQAQAQAQTAVAEEGPAVGGQHTLGEIERAHVERVLGRAASLDDAARTLGIDVSTLYRKRKQLGG